MLEKAVPGLDPSIFRSYDIRGIVGKSLTEEAVCLIGQAIGSLLHERGENEIAVARDGRLSSPALIEKLCAGIQSTGCHVMDIDIVPTPLLYTRDAMSIPVLASDGRHYEASQLVSWLASGKKGSPLQRTETYWLQA